MFKSFIISFILSIFVYIFSSSLYLSAAMFVAFIVLDILIYKDFI